MTLAHLFLQVSFNSMKVRLKREKVLALTRNLSPFQFHEGPIKTFATFGWYLRSICVSIP